MWGVGGWLVVSTAGLAVWTSSSSHDGLMVSVETVWGFSIPGSAWRWPEMVLDRHDFCLINLCPLPIVSSVSFV
jgi:hypothetical protein